MINKVEKKLSTVFKILRTLSINNFNQPAVSYFLLRNVFEIFYRRHVQQCLF